MAGADRYTPYYCEENVWHLCQRASLDGFEKEIVFISNPQRACLLWEQKASKTPQMPVCWDYHVILMVRRGSWMAWDLDSRLGLSVPAERYFEKTFRVGWSAPPLFRLLGSGEFVARFDSDRSHMRTPEGGWQAAPPPWPPIRSVGGYRLRALIDMERRTPGRVLTLNQLQGHYGRVRAKTPRTQS